MDTYIKSIECTQIFSKLNILHLKASVLQDTLWSVLQNCPFLSCQEYWKSTCTLECQKSTLLVLKK